MALTWPNYLELARSGELARRAREAVDALADCAACPRQCHADRQEQLSARSYCRTGRLALVSSAFAHHGEEDCLRGREGSGTIFFSQCNLRCLFCQNFDISWESQGRPVRAEELADVMLRLQGRGCHNINLVTPTHVVPQILEGLVVAAERGLRLPLVYNTGGYERLETLRWLDGIVDIYMPDFKFWDAKAGKRLCGCADYPARAKEALREMHRQVGDLELDDSGIAVRGILLRHLVMPSDLAGTRRVMRFVAREISPRTYVNIMPQYRPCGAVHGEPDVGRRVTAEEFRDAVSAAVDEGIQRLDDRNSLLFF